MYYTTIKEQLALGVSMSTVAERVGAESVALPAHSTTVRGYDFVPKDITDETERDFIFRSLFPVGLEAFVQNPSVEMEEDIKAHLFDADHLLVMRSDGSYHFGTCEIGAPRPIAFRMWKNYATRYGNALYLAGMCVLPAWQGKGIGQTMTRYAIEKVNPKVVFTVTQNPVVKECMDKAVGTESYPSLWGANGTTMGDLVRELGEKLGKSVDASTSIIKGNYGASLYGIQPTSRTPKYNQLFDRLNKQEGDAFLLAAVRR